jgi:sugar phosphate isomerase/epimerase
VGWHERNVEFWKPLAQYAADHGVTVALENMWEFDPTIIIDLLEAVNHPNLRACLDIGHAHLFSEANITLQDWLRVVEPWLVHCHMNNNNGKIDEHHGFDFERGVINYKEVLRMVHELTVQPTIVLEMDTVQDMRESLYYLKIDESTSTPA